MFAVAAAAGGQARFWIGEKAGQRSVAGEDAQQKDTEEPQHDPVSIACAAGLTDSGRAAEPAEFGPGAEPFLPLRIVTFSRHGGERLANCGAVPERSQDPELQRFQSAVVDAVIETVHRQEYLLRFQAVRPAPGR